MKIVEHITILSKSCMVVTGLPEEYKTYTFHSLTKDGKKHK